MSCSIFEKIDSLGFPFLLFVVSDEVLKARRRDQDDAMNQHPQEGQLDREDCDSFVTPFLLTSCLESRDEILV